MDPLLFPLKLCILTNKYLFLSDSNKLNCPKICLLRQFQVLVPLQFPDDSTLKHTRSLANFVAFSVALYSMTSIYKILATK